MPNEIADEYDADSEIEFLATYDPSGFDRIGVTVDVALFRLERAPKATAQILLIKRGRPPYKGRWALPGGFVELSEDLDEAASRELWEETGIEVAPSRLRQIHTYGAPGRDPRMRIVSIVYGLVLTGTDSIDDLSAGDDAADAEMFSSEDLFGASPKVRLAFDHERVVSDSFAWLREQVPLDLP